MSAPFHKTVHVHSIKNEPFNRTMVFTLPNGISKTDVLGRLVEPDPAVPCGMKLLTDGAQIHGSVARIDVYEDRGMITAQFRFSELVPILANDTLAQGDPVVGAGNGFVKKGVAGNSPGVFVAEVLTIKGVKYASIVKL
ncbi:MULTISPECIES: hypothetical protein [Methylobacterium]|jgi:hypothetical protein|uniref:Uncharacterized protein n=1 Tax=Methylobacterium jeotgali TaxID=381630 RepID=A0ABQ4T1T7_9HYPH|nr:MULTISPECIES: hypothetical protein [Methylobacterium]PIU05658.1 MAG: hypothetical protein COT56_13520 [Methylobacterium sp. CG09_land_8_20_14_0_10_71_15]PIU12368.1 MAG: hypothetical protein COT28_15365 [Methylobacterium sp. CG08_land_8_20_14_0_20_71_15]GBU16880.1 hypothetical protein AwMethylo_10950 [Methylobacterium sp.]GJE07974.1 hypothetical protein AOPFMNJM_3306 [Methylobacterium jeotgali]